MAKEVVHFEVIGRDPERLRAFYSRVFGWEYAVGEPSDPTVSAAGQYGFVTNAGLNGGVAGGPGFDPKLLFYVQVDEVEATLRAAEEVGGRRLLGPTPAPPGGISVGQFLDPEGNLMGVAGMIPAESE